LAVDPLTIVQVLQSFVDPSRDDVSSSAYLKESNNGKKTSVTQFAKAGKMNKNVRREWKARHTRINP
jgi:hypothetical protein